MVSAIERDTRAPKCEHAEGLDGVLPCNGTLVRLWVSLVHQDS
ncbi:hypothetical protein CLV63_1177 [Murinocardiopsis flavida]|uniref:Uncharacterized protein n=1 Tax=Murinocardiopsis flavida TaxID=645275 RepID=A0A2P8D6G9_9ACTN|nr:hypothetical protein [Murinocardiopsis flavida]PSK92802.1 hypothetical protein CLV63_1177 [Murinocardiopsis flavida]